MPMNRFTKSLFLLLGLSVAACSGSDVKQTLGMDNSAPDEFTVVSRPPLSVPKEFYLVPPEPGAGTFSKDHADDQARAALTGQPITSLDSSTAGLADTAAPVVETSSLPTPAESSILQKAGAASADPAIKQKLYEDYKGQEATNPGFLGTLRGDTNADPVVNAPGEAERIKGNKAANKPLNEGEVPIDDPKKQSVIDRIF